MSKVLIVDDDRGTSEILGIALRVGGFEVWTAKSGIEGLETGLRIDPDVAFVDAKLPDMSGLFVLEEFKRQRPQTSVIITTKCGTSRGAVEAMRLGALDYIDKPVALDQLVPLVLRALSTREPRDIGAFTPHAATRWAEIIVRVADSPNDPKTLHHWGRFIGASRGAIRNWCSTVRLSPRHSLYFARVLRAVIRQRDGCRPEDLLDVADLRTLRKLLTLGGGKSATSISLPQSVEEFIEVQRWITHPFALDEVRKALRTRSRTNFP